MAFQSNAFQNNGFQVIAGEAPAFFLRSLPQRRRRLRVRGKYLEQRQSEWAERLQAEYDFTHPQIAPLIQELAYRQSQDLTRDDEQRFEELERELEIQGIEWQARYLEALNVQRERLIEQEIGALLRAKLQEDEAMLLIVVAATI